MNDMTSVIVPKSDQINADDLIGRTMTITIRDVQIRGGQEQPVSIVFDGSDKVYRPCKSMSRVLVAAWGPDAKKYIGRSLTLYRDPTVKWGGMEVGGIRISHMSDIERDMVLALTATKGSRKPYTVKPLANVPVKGADDPAVKWANAYVAKIRAEKDPAALRTFIADKAAKLEELRGKRPELAAEIDLALADLDLSTQPSSADGSGDDAGSSTAAIDPEAPPSGLEDEGAGELVTLASAIAQIDAAETVIDVNRILSAHEGSFDGDDLDRLRGAAAARIDALKGGK